MLTLEADYTKHGTAAFAILTELKKEERVSYKIEEII